MTKILGVIMDSGRGFMKNITFRYVKGQTIASKKIISNNNNTKKQARQRNGFAEVAKLAKSLSEIIEIGFKSQKTWSRRNAFTHYNASLMEFARNNTLYNPQIPPITNLCITLSNLDFKGKVFSAWGREKITAFFRWDDDFHLEGSLYYSREYMEGDKIVVALCYSYMEMGSYFEMVQMFEKVLTPQDIARLPAYNQFEINTDTFPDIDVFGEVPIDALYIEILATAIVVGKKDISTSVFVPMPSMPYTFEISEMIVRSYAFIDLLVANPQTFDEEFSDEVVDGIILIDYGMGKGIHKFVVESVIRNEKSGDVTLSIKSTNNDRIKQPLSGMVITKVPIVKDERIIGFITEMIVPDLE